MTADMTIDATPTLDPSNPQHTAVAEEVTPEFDAVASFLEHLRCQLMPNLPDEAIKVFDSFKGQELMGVSWKPRGENSNVEKKFSLKVDSYHPKSRQLQLALSLNGATNPVLVPVTKFYWYKQTKGDDIGLQVNIGDKTTVAKFLRFEQVLPKSEQEEQTVLHYSSDVRLSFGVTRLPDYEEFAQTFFSTEGSHGKEHYGFHSGRSVFSSRLGCFDLQYESGKTWSFVPVEIEAQIKGQEVVSTTFKVGTTVFSSFGEFIAHLCLAHVMVRVPLLLYGEAPELMKFTSKLDSFLKPKHFELPRPVSLNPHEVRTKLQAKGYEFAWHVLDAACTSLNAGKHVIFTGPPGCGKSTLAVELASIAAGKDKREPLVATASPSWTSADLIGRYLPRRDAQGLRFEPGFFLNAIKNQQWLIIDELNRANIDSAFGELFSVLAGDAPQLPFRAVQSDEFAFEDDDEAQSDDEEIEGNVPKPVRIIPFAHDKRDAFNDQYIDYHVPQRFRMLATMNDADRSRLHQLSFAFQRRFNIIRVEAPKAKVINDIIKSWIDKYSGDYKLSKKTSKDQCAYYIIQGTGNNRNVYLESDIVQATLMALFAREDDNPAQQDFHDLTRERVTGIATILDIIRFTAEALRAPVIDGSGDETRNKNELIRALHLRGGTPTSSGADKLPVVNGHLTPSIIANQLIQSYIAMAVTMSVVPQLESLSGNVPKLFAAIRTCLLAFEEDALLWRIENADERYELVSGEPIRDFIAGEIALQLGRETLLLHAEYWESLKAEGLISRIPR